MSSSFADKSAPPCPRGFPPPLAWARRVRHRASHQDRGRLCPPYGLLALALALVAATAARGQPVQSDAAQRFVGVWRYVGTWIDGKPRPNRGANPKGYIFYAASGEMAAQIAPDRVNPMAGPTPTAEEAKAALADYVAYFGTWSLDERAGTVTHHRHASVQPGPLTDYVRTYEFKGNRLILRPVGTTQEVVWERIR